jgi:flotillin
VAKEQQIVVQEREIQRREKELEATVKRLADAERYRVETEAAATRSRAEQVAKGEAEARRQKRIAEADVIRATGTSEAEIIALKGASEAEAMRKKADSFKEYNQAAVLQILVAALPEIARAVAEPLSKTDRITIVSTGGDGVGASKLTGDVAKAMAEIPAVIESLSGVELKKLVEAIPALKAAMADRPREKGTA